MEKRVLMISQCDVSLTGVRDALSGFDIALVVKSGIVSGLKAVRDDDIVILDSALGDKTLREFRSYHPETVAVYLKAADDPATALDLGVFDCLSKPLRAPRLKAAIRNALETIALRKEIGRLKNVRTQNFISSRSRGMLKAVRQIERAAAKDSAVLISGDRGTGKSLTAKMIHYGSHRRSRALVQLDSLTEAMAEDFFGKASDLGSGKSIIASAQGGTLFIQRIEEIGPEFSARLGRLIKDKTYSPIGSDNQILADLRIICGMNGHKLDEPLYRSFSMEIIIPSLRDRAEDIVPLAEHFIKEAAAEFGMEERRLTKDAIKFLSEYNWPGNVGELKRVIRQAVLLSGNEEIGRNHLAEGAGPTVLSIKEFLEGKLAKYIRDTAKVGRADIFGTVIGEVEKSLIEIALRETGDNQLRSARALGITRTTLRTKIRAYGIKIDPK